MAEFPDFTFASNEEIADTLGRRLKAIRLQQGLRQVDLAASAGVAPATLKALENQGNCTLASLIQVARALGLEGDLQALFLPQPVRSIAAMEEQAQPARKRAPTKRAPSRPPAKLQPASRTTP